MREGKVRVGIVGANVHYGWGTRAHVPAIEALPELELAAVCTTHKETAEETARRYGIPLAFHDPEALARHPDIDLVTVCTRAPTHHGLVKLALEAGKHVFCEWPLGANLGEARQSRDLAEARKVRHMVCLQGRGSPVFSYVKELVGGGYAGQVLSCTLVASLPGAGRRVGWPEGVDRARGVGTLAIAGGHSLDCLSFCLGEFREVSAVVATQVKKAVHAETGAVLDVTTPDNVSISGVLKSGAVVAAHIKSVPDFGTGFLLEIDGAEGALVVSSDQSAQIGEPRLRGARKGEGGFRDLPIPAKHRWVPAGVPEGPPYNVAQMYRKLAQAVREGSPVDPDFNLAVTRHTLLDAIQRASDTGQRQAV